MKKYPLKISYIAKTALWAGKRLSEEYGKVSTYDRISETWELSVRENDEAIVLCGEAKGLKLSEYFDACGYDCVTPTYKKGDRFPLLIKLIDADDTLSVQVHPDDAYASRVENDSGKTEAWHIISAQEGAQIIYGLREGTTREALGNAIKNGCVETVMKYQRVSAGDICKKTDASRASFFYFCKVGHGSFCISNYSSFHKSSNHLCAKFHNISF